MREKSTETVGTSSPTWETLEAFARQSMQQLLQRLLEEEVDGLLGRGRYARREAVDPAAGYRNGFGKPRRVSLSSGTLTVRRPRVRGLTERFESRLLPAFKRRTEEVGRLLPELYLHGLALGDFDLALRGLLGDGAPLSAAAIARLKAGWQAEYELWRTRAVADLEVVYLWVDGIYVKAGLEKDKAAMLVVLAAGACARAHAHEDSQVHAILLCDRSSSAAEFSCSANTVIGAGRWWADEAGLGGSFEVWLIGAGIDIPRLTSETYPEHFRPPVSESKRAWRHAFEARLGGEGGTLPTNTMR